MGFLGGAALLTAAVAVSKLLGALYKIPLGNLLGSRCLFMKPSDLPQLIHRLK